ncbi:MAG TPA: cell division protein FtsQ/DivIB [Methylophaga aminisulfidivorans]|uniref:Cell division protein FtsQ n=1 Tax=Methylophaga aminisulfidivorans TaxID=230105 RepID=A0A7C1W7Z0_9GAMM|nr:cell division protein FtsQ/DivIB [Methylophaga aminisulfidivorans]
MAKRASGATFKPKAVKAQKRAINWALIAKQCSVLVLVLTILAGGMYLHEADTLPVKHVTVEGALQHTNKDALISAVTPFVSGSFLDVDVANVQQAGKTLPWVEQVQVRRIWPDTLHLIVKEHQAIARWNDDGLVNNRGEVFKPNKHTFPDGLIQLNGPEGTSDMMARRLVSIQQKVDAIGVKVIKLSMDKRRSWQVDFNDGLHLKLGRADSDKRVNRFVDVFQSGLASYKDVISEVDMRYTNGLAVVWKDGQQPDFNGTV